MTPDQSEAEILDLAKLREIAEAATPGPWIAGHLCNDDHPCDCAHILCESYMGAVATVGVRVEGPLGEGGNDEPPLEEAKANQRHIATFDPPTVLRLLALLSEQQVGEDDLEESNRLANEGIVKAVLKWLGERDLYEPQDFFHEGIAAEDVIGLLDMHEQALIPPPEQQVREPVEEEGKGSAGSDLSRASPSPDQRFAGSFDAETQLAEALSDPEWLAKWNSSEDERRPLIHMLNDLRREEGDSVTLLSDNADFNGQPNNAIECNGGWTDWLDRRFTGDTLHEAVLSAWKARQEGSASVIGSSDERSVHAEPLPTPPPEQQVESGRLREIAAFLVHQHDEPNPFSNMGDRGHYWRDKCIEAATRLEALSLSPSPAQAEGGQ